MLLRQLIATLGCVVQRHQNGKPSLPHGGVAGMGEQTRWNARHQTLRVTAEEGANLLEGSELPWNKSVCLVATKIIETQGKGNSHHAVSECVVWSGEGRDDRFARVGYDLQRLVLQCSSADGGVSNTKLSLWARLQRMRPRLPLHYP